MTIRRVTALVSASLLVLLTIAVAEAALLVLLVLFSSILRVQLTFELGESLLQLWTNVRPGPPLVTPTMTVLEGGIFASALFSLACGGAAGAWRYRRWRPA